MGNPFEKINQASINQEAFIEKRKEIHSKKLEKELAESDERLLELAKEFKMDLTNMAMLYALEEDYLRSIDPAAFDPKKERSPIIDFAIKNAIWGGRDTLTSLPNRRLFLKKIGNLVYDGDKNRREGDTAEKEPNKLSIIMMDIDHFKKINDTFGHDAGDYVLRRIAMVFDEETRGDDTIARWGGEEFIAVAPDGKEGRDLKFAERLRKMVEDTKFVFDGKEIDVTISVGIAPYNGDFEENKDTADKALYAAKGEFNSLKDENIVDVIDAMEKGDHDRNRVCYYDGETKSFKRYKPKEENNIS